MTLRAANLPERATLWNPLGAEPWILTQATASAPDADGMVLITAAELDQPLRIAGDWPIDLTTPISKQKRRHQMTCTKCTQEIRRGDEYVAISRTTERIGRLGSIKVTDAELQATYHPECAPPSGHST